MMRVPLTIVPLRLWEVFDVRGSILDKDAGMLPTDAGLREANVRRAAPADNPGRCVERNLGSPRRSVGHNESHPITLATARAPL